MNGIYIPDWRERIHFSSNGPPHPEGLAIYYFLEGTGWMTLDDEKLRLSPGVIIITEEGAVRGMQAETELSFMAMRATTLDKD